MRMWAGIHWVRLGLSFCVAVVDECAHGCSYSVNRTLFDQISDSKVLLMSIN
jgi:hypothetical protein